MKKTDNQVIYVRVARDVRDASKDYSLPRDEALRLYGEGRISRDLTNGGYVEHDGGFREVNPPRYSRYLSSY